MEHEISKVIIYIFVVSNILIACLVSLVAYSLVHENKRSVFHAGARTGITSVACNDLSTHPDDDWETFDKERNRWQISVNRQGQYLCGTKNITDIVDKIVEKQSRIWLSSGLEGPQYLACGNRSLAPPSGEMTAYFTRIKSRQNVTETEIQGKVNWDKLAGYSYIDTNIAYENGEITIPEGRTYFVYASVSFNWSQTEEQQNRPYRLTLRICKKIYGYERTLLGKVEVYNSPVKGTVTSLNVAGHVLLQKDDILLVRVSNVQWLHHISKGNTFGIFPL